jgi:succinyldiaminopimelate transaminase
MKRRAVNVQGFEPPPYPYDRLEPSKAKAERHVGGLVDLSVGTPCDPPLAAVLEALGHSGTERGYPASIGSDALRRAAVDWMRRRFEIDVPIADVAACIGTKEFVASTPHYLRLRSPDRDVVLYPAVAYPTYEMGAIFAGCRPVPVALDAHGRLDLASIDPTDADRALCLWANSPSNPTGALDDLEAVAAWGRANGVLVLSDECYCEFTWNGPARSILQHGFEGLIAVHSLSKRSNLAGVRVGLYAGDSDVVHYLKEVRKHAGMMIPGPAQAAGVAALADDGHVDEQRDRYRRRLDRLATVLTRWSGHAFEPPAGGFYLWAPVGDGWAFADALAEAGGALVSPGDFYGSVSNAWARVAAVQPDDRIDLVASRLA